MILKKRILLLASPVELRFNKNPIVLITPSVPRRIMLAMRDRWRGRVTMIVRAAFSFATIEKCLLIPVGGQMCSASRAHVPCVSSESHVYRVTALYYLLTTRTSVKPDLCDPNSTRRRRTQFKISDWLEEASSDEIDKR